MFEKGKPRHPAAGRRPGSPNKSSVQLKAAILGAFKNVGGMAYLEGVAKTDPRTFCTLLGRILPTQITAKFDESVRVVFVEAIVDRITPAAGDGEVIPGPEPILQLAGAVPGVCGGPGGG